MSDNNKILLSVRDLSVEIETEAATVKPLDQISFDLRAGETFALLGESGCGKSMTALSLMRLLPTGGRITQGSVLLDGQDLCGLTESQMRNIRGGKLAMIFQEPGTALNPVYTVGQQIGEVLRLHRRLTGAPAREAARELLNAVGIPDPDRRLTEYPFQMSGGMKQRVMIAMALAGEPELLVADEPTTALDVTIQAQVLDVLVALQRERGMGMLLITHDLGVVARVADRIGVMYAGQLVEIADRERFFRNAAHPYSRKLFEALPEGKRNAGPLATIPGRVPLLNQRFAGCRFADRCAAVMPHCASTLPTWHDAPTGQRVRCLRYAADAAPMAQETALAQGTETTLAEDKPGVPLLSTRDLKVHFPIKRGVLQRTVGHVKAVDGLSLTLRAGKTLALVGESGCGKTTAGKALLNLIRATDGEIVVNGQPLARDDRHAWRALRRQAQMVFQDPFGSLNPRLRVGEAIEEGLLALDLEPDTSKRRHRITAMLEQVGLRPDMADRYPHEFSGGQRQRIALARALAVEPKLIICDEPTSALDVSVQAQVLNLMRDLQQRLGLAYLFITHNIGVVEYLADEVAVMYLGRIVEQGPAESVLAHPRHPYTQALLAAVPRVTLESETAAAPPPGDLPSPANPPKGCHYHPRCARATDQCRTEYPQSRSCASEHTVACHFALS